MEYRHRPIVVKAIQFTGGKRSAKEVIRWLKDLGIEGTRRKAAESWEYPDGRYGGRGWREAVLLGEYTADMFYVRVDHVEKDWWLVFGHDGRERLITMESEEFDSLYMPK